MRTDVPLAIADSVRYMMEYTNKASFANYKTMLKQGVPRQLARSVLPVGTYTHMFTTVSLHNLFNFLRERLHPHAQYEIRVYAEAMLELITPVAPVAVGAFKDSLIKP